MSFEELRRRSKHGPNLNNSVQVGGKETTFLGPLDTVVLV